MALPTIALPKKSVDINGTSVEIRSLSRAEAFALSSEYANRPDDAEIFVLARGTGVPEAEAKEWRDVTDPITAGKLVDAIIYLTGLATPEGDDPKADTNAN